MVLSLEVFRFCTTTNNNIQKFRVDCRCYANWHSQLESRENFGNAFKICVLFCFRFLTMYAIHASSYTTDWAPNSASLIRPVM